MRRHGYLFLYALEKQRYLYARHTRRITGRNISRPPHTQHTKLFFMLQDLRNATNGGPNSPASEGRVAGRGGSSRQAAELPWGPDRQHISEQLEYLHEAAADGRLVHASVRQGV